MGELPENWPEVAELQRELARVGEELERQLGEKAAFAAAAVEQQARAEKAEVERDEALAALRSGRETT